MINQLTMFTNYKNSTQIYTIKNKSEVDSNRSMKKTITKNKEDKTLNATRVKYFIIYYFLFNFIINMKNVFDK